MWGANRRYKWNKTVCLLIIIKVRWQVNEDLLYYSCYFRVHLKIPRNNEGFFSRRMPRWNWHLRKCSPGNKKAREGAVGRLIVQGLNCSIGSGGEGLGRTVWKETHRVGEAKEMGIEDDAQVSGCMMGPFTQQRNSEEIKVRGEGVIDQFLTGCIWGACGHPEFRKEACTGDGFWQLPAAAQFPWKHEKGRRKKMLQSCASIIQLINYSRALLTWKKSKWLNPGEEYKRTK